MFQIDICAVANIVTNNESEKKMVKYEKLG